MSITFPSMAGREYRFESAIDLTVWTPILNGGYPLTVPLGFFPGTTNLLLLVLLS